MKKVLFVNPRFVIRHPPLALGYLSSYVNKYYPGVYEFKLHDYAFQDDNALAGSLRGYQPDIIAITSTTNTFNDAVRVCTAIKKFVDVPIIVGGIHITAIPEDLIGSPFDIGVIGEGEETFLELLKKYNEKGKLQSDEIKGVAFVMDGKLVITAPRPLIADLDTVPMPDYSLFAMREYYARPKAIAHGFYAKGTSMVPSRGCPDSNCSFCASDIMWRNKVRLFSAKRVFDEIEYLVTTYGLNSIIFLDDNFTTSKKWMKELAGYIANSSFHKYFRFDCESIAEFVDDEKLKILKAMGCERIEFGLESGCERIARALKNDRVSVDKYSNTIALCNKNNIEILGNFIYGWFDETVGEISQTVDFIKNHAIDFIAWHTLAPYPGTEVWQIFSKVVCNKFGSFESRKYYDIDTGTGLFPFNDNMNPEESERIFRHLHRSAFLQNTFIVHMLGLDDADKKELLAHFEGDMKALNIINPKIHATESYCISQETLTKICQRLEEELPLSTQEILGEFDLLSGHPWAQHAASPFTNYYACLHALAATVKPSKILEIGTAFGMSGASLVKACNPLELFISVDLGFFHNEYNFPESNLKFAERKIQDWCVRQSISPDKAKYFQGNSQPDGKSDNENKIEGVPHWTEVPELLALLQPQSFDVLFVDGKHTEDGLYNDMVSFWRYLKPGGILLCDDLHDPAVYKQLFPWAGQTLDSFHRFVNEYRFEIEEWHIWSFPHVLPPTFEGIRPFGIIRKKTASKETSKQEQSASIKETLASWINTIASRDKRLYYRDQTVESLSQLVKYVQQYRPTRVVELGTLLGLSLRTWLSADSNLHVTAIDLSFDNLLKSKEFLPLDLSRVTLHQQNILEVDFSRLWASSDRVILYVDAHDMQGVPIMEHVLKYALPVLPRGSVVIVDDLWYSRDELTGENADSFFHSVVINEIDPLQCFDGYYAPYWRGGSFMGFMEVVPLMEWVNCNNVELTFSTGIKSVMFEWR